MAYKTTIIINDKIYEQIKLSEAGLVYYYSELHKRCLKKYDPLKAFVQRTTNNDCYSAEAIAAFIARGDHNIISPYYYIYESNSLPMVRLLAKLVVPDLNVAEINKTNNAAVLNSLLQNIENPAVSSIMSIVRERRQRREINNNGNKSELNEDADKGE